MEHTQPVTPELRRYLRPVLHEAGNTLLAVSALVVGIPLAVFGVIAVFGSIWG